MLFDPFQALLASFIVQAAREFVLFLKSKGLPFPELDSWLAAAATAIAAFLVAFGDLLAGRLPANVQVILTLVLKFILTFLAMVGVHKLLILPVKSLYFAASTYIESYWSQKD